MNTNVNLPAAMGVLALLGTGFCLFVAGLLIVHGLVAGRIVRAAVVLVAALAGLCLYVALVFAFSFASLDRALARGEEKHFCEIDCHLAYSVIDVEKTPTVGIPPDQTRARGMYYVITVKTRFDETTISPKRGDGLLTPNSRVASIRDNLGREFRPAPEGQRALDRSGQGGTPMSTALRPGESYTTRVVFDLPPDVSDPALLLNEGEWITHLIIGHENSPLHKQVRFRLDPAPAEVEKIMSSHTGGQ